MDPYSLRKLPCFEGMKWLGIFEETRNVSAFMYSFNAGLLFRLCRVAHRIPVCLPRVWGLGLGHEHVLVLVMLLLVFWCNSSINWIWALMWCSTSREFCNGSLLNTMMTNKRALIALPPMSVPRLWQPSNP